MSLRDELLLLVKDTLSLYKEEMPQMPAQPKKIKAPAPNAIEIEAPKVKEEEQTLPKYTPSPRHHATLDMKENLQRLMPKLKLHETPCSVVLLAMQRSDIEFLQSVAGAISEHFLPAQVIEIQNETECLELLQRRYIRYIAAALADLKKFKELAVDLKNAQLHQLLTLRNVPYLPLDTLQSYAQDPTKKRHLWNTLKSTLPSSQILPSVKL